MFIIHSNSMRILITGGAGFIGSHLAEALKKQGHEVVVFDNLASGNGNLEFLKNSGSKLVKGNVAKFEEIKTAAKGIDPIYHLAAMNRFQRSVEKPLESFNINSLGTSNVLEAARQNDVKQVIFSSSSSVYGDSKEFPRKEDGKIDPSHNYGASKVVGELYCKTYQKLYDLNTTVLRFFSVYGPKQRGDIDYAAVIPKFILNLLNGKALTIYGDGSQSRSFTYMADNVAANIACMGNKKAFGEIINISDSKEFTITELVKLLEKVSGKKAKLEYMPLPKGDIQSNTADVSKAKKLLNWETKISFEDGLRKTFEWMKKN